MEGSRRGNPGLLFNTLYFLSLSLSFLAPFVYSVVFYCVFSSYTHSVHILSYTITMTAAADVRFKLNTGAEIPALGLGMSILKL